MGYRPVRQKNALGSRSAAGAAATARREGGTKGRRGPLVFSERQGDLTRKFYFSQETVFHLLANQNSSLTVKVAADKKQSVLGAGAVSSPPIHERLAAMDRLRLRRQPPIRPVQDERRGDPQGRLRALDAGHEKPVRGGAHPGMHRQDRERAETAFHRRQDRGQSLRAVDQRKPSPGPQERE